MEFKKLKDTIPPDKQPSFELAERAIKVIVLQHIIQITGTIIDGNKNTDLMDNYYEVVNTTPFMKFFQKKIRTLITTHLGFVFVQEKTWPNYTNNEKGTEPENMDERIYKFFVQFAVRARYMGQ